ncbi:DNA polymerase III subunit alpha [Mycoplasma sp. CSL7503-lung]|uniref:DNA polymerase III subunit alpha n=1 Tax=Mycoplasma sp. CSL7503-lung TaxID=536372 RepID=UPI0021D18776|nr:DNA polymerase III subunit alpha [Mycoplasma sp. CSL7503-lung]MCU4706718.1 DNA polymerase III subunit alpha [Mycoplasma sp. CSL7503-lung]
MREKIYLHTNTEYSFLSSTIRVQELLELAKEKNIKYIPLTDKENLFGLQYYWNFQEKYDFKPIIGSEFYLNENFTIIVLAKNNQGLKLIQKLIYKKSKGDNLSLFDFESNDLFVIDHFELGMVAKEIFLSKLPNNFYFNSKKNINNRKVVYAPTKRILHKEDNQLLPLLNFINPNNDVVNKIYDDYFLDNEFEELDQEVYDQMLNIVESINITKPNSEIKLANFSDDNIEIFKKLIFGKRYKKIIKEYDTKIVNDRINYEFNVIKQLGFINYFLIIQDALSFARKQGIEIGPGRGSASGSLISYLLEITSVNPLEFNLLFERFLNVERVTLPDIDIDIQDTRRDEVFEYVKNKYGEENVSFISTFQTLASKNSIRDTARFINHNEVIIPKDEIDKISASISSKFSNLIENYESNKKYKVWADKYPQLHNLASRIEGLPRQTGVHPAGLIICNQPLYNVVPVRKNQQTLQQVEMTLDNLEKYGLIKIDFLGLKNLTFINNIEKNLEPENHFDSILEDNVSLFNDKITFNLLNSLNTNGIFQLESPGMKKTIKDVRIDSFDDIYAIISLFRPGPLEYIPIYAKNKNNPYLIEKIHPIYDWIVKSTFGIIVYQEQIMEIVQKISGLSFAQADLLRRAISKKDESKLHAYRKMFFEGGIRNNINFEILKKIYFNIEKFANYGFNKSHAVAYALIAYKLAYYKARFPMLFFKVLLSESSGDLDAIKKYSDEAFLCNINIETPSINYSSDDANIHNNSIFLPLLMIKGLGKVAIDKIVYERSINGFYNNFIEAYLRMRMHGLSESNIDLLIKSGSMREFNNINTLLSWTNIAKTFYSDLALRIKRNNISQEEYNSYLLDFIKELNLEIYIKNLPIESNDLKEQKELEIKLLGNSYNTSYHKVHNKQIDHNVACLANVEEEKIWLEVELISVKVGFKNERQTSLKISDFSTTVTANGFNSKIRNLINLDTRRKIRVLISKKDNRFYNILNYEEIYGE